MDIKLAEGTPAFRRELKVVFPNVNTDQINVVFTFQDSRVNFLDIDMHINEKDHCLKQFFNFSEAVGEKLKYWWDYIDPCSGYPMREDPAGFYSDVDACQRLLRLPVIHIGSCWVISHPQYGTSVYIGSFITDAPIEHIQQVLEDLD